MRFIKVICGLMAGMLIGCGDGFKSGEVDKNPAAAGSNDPTQGGADLKAEKTIGDYKTVDLTTVISQASKYIYRVNLESKTFSFGLEGGDFQSCTPSPELLATLEKIKSVKIVHLATPKEVACTQDQIDVNSYEVFNPEAGDAVTVKWCGTIENEYVIPQVETLGDLLTFRTQFFLSCAAEFEVL